MCFALLHFTDIVSLQIEGKTLHQQKDYDLLYGNTCFIVVVWKWTHSISEVCLYLKISWWKITKRGLDSIWLNPDICKYNFVDSLFCLHTFIYLKWDNGGEKQGLIK